MGFDTNLQRAYDAGKLGWKYDALACGAAGTIPYLDCSPNGDPNSDPALQQLLSLLDGNFWFVFNLTAPPVLLSNAEIENRKIFNTHTYGHSNAGHEFTSVLTDAERKAIIEYLKTL
jgi:hypothetical protein